MCVSNLVILRLDFYKNVACQFNKSLHYFCQLIHLVNTLEYLWIYLILTIDAHFARVLFCSVILTVLTRPIYPSSPYARMAMEVYMETVADLGCGSRSTEFL